MFGLSILFGGIYVTDKYLNEIHTKDELKEIKIALENYHQFNKAYPTDYMEFVNKKPILEVMGNR